jgi:hypothetical protein
MPLPDLARERFLFGLRATGSWSAAARWAGRASSAPFRRLAGRDAEFARSVEAAELAYAARLAANPPTYPVRRNDVVRRRSDRIHALARAMRSTDR